MNTFTVIEKDAGLRTLRSYKLTGFDRQAALAFAQSKPRGLVGYVEVWTGDGSQARFVDGFENPALAPK